MSAPELRVEAPLAKLHRLRELQARLALLDEAAAARYRADPVAWAGDRLGVHLWSKQRETAASVVANRRTAVQSAADVGKSFLAAILALWWVDVHPRGEAIVVSTAPSYEQVHAILWEEIRKHHRGGEPALPGTVQMSDRWLLDDGTLVGLGRKPPDHAESVFQGIHRRYVLVILDEAGGLKANLWSGAEAITTNADCRILAIGNPDDSSSHFAKMCQPGSLWHTIRISAFESPNLTGERVPEALRHVLVSRETVDDAAVQWGADNPLYLSKMLGLFSDADDGLIPLSWITAAQARWARWAETFDGSHEPAGRRVFGVDVARFGRDKTAVCTRQGHVVMRPVELFAHHDTVAVADLVEARLTHPTSVAVVDADGVGGGVVDVLRRRRCNVLAFSGAAATKRRDVTGTQRFRATRSAAWWNVRELLDPRRDPELCLPADDQLAADLAAPKWPQTTGNVIQVEPKDQIVARLGRSPDAGDSVVMSLWVEQSSVTQPTGEDRLRPRSRARAYTDSVGPWA